VSVLLAANNLTKSFGSLVAVNGISLSVKRGEVLGFLGPNGAGKTTTMKMLTGFLAPTSGDAAVCDKAVTTGNVDAKRHIGYLPEGAPLYGDMTPREFLTFVAETHEISKAEIPEIVESASNAVNLAKVMNQRIETLSKGFKRRVGLAAAIIHAPDVLILDEPTDGLDPNQKHEVRSLIETMSADRAIIISTHILEEVDALCSRVVVINEGKIVADDTPSGLRGRSRYKNAVTMVSPKSAAGEIILALKPIPGVASIEQVIEGDVIRITALARNGAQIADDVGGVIASNNWEIHQYSIEGGRLDDVFRSLTEANRTGDTA
jgi:ABC-2 type transport system ATP-binding protein